MVNAEKEDNLNSSYESQRHNLPDPISPIKNVDKRIKSEAEPA